MCFVTPTNTLCRLCVHLIIKCVSVSAGRAVSVVSCIGAVAAFIVVVRVYSSFLLMQFL